MASACTSSSITSQPSVATQQDYKGFVAGIFSGISKLAVGHPFDTIKVRLQTAPASRFRGPLACLRHTLLEEGARALYKGATPPLVGWIMMDSLMLGSLSVYRRLLAEHVFKADCTYSQPQSSLPLPSYSTASGAADHAEHVTGDFDRAIHAGPTAVVLPAYAHGIAGFMGGMTVSVIASPVEHLKARLQTQYAADKSHRFYKSSIDCACRIYHHHGLRGLYHGFTSTLVFRSFFFFWWSSYDLLCKSLRTIGSDGGQNSKGAAVLGGEAGVNFLAGGLSAQVFWCTSYPTDVVKQRIMTDSLGGTLGDGTPKYPRKGRWIFVAKAIYAESGWAGFWRGFVPCFLRAFPANATALLAFEAVLRFLNQS